jgi:ADP-ribosylglycohydrolase
MKKKLDSIIGSLLGTAVGDAKGLIYENLSKRRQLKLYPEIEKYYFLFGRGMCSDDTEHTIMTAQSIISSGGDLNKFSKILAWKLRFWLLGLPAGIGFATLKSILKLWVGFSPGKSGVFSAGNGPAMRAPIVGVCFGDDIDILKNFVQANTKITHNDPKAEYGSLAVALAAHMAGASESDIDPLDYFNRLDTALKNKEAKEFLELMRTVITSVVNNESTMDLVCNIGQKKGISGYIYHTVPAVIHCWLKNQDNFKDAVIEIIRCGGDTDTTASILGGIIGARVSKQGIPGKWIKELCEYPRNTAWIESLGERLYNVMAGKKKKKSLKVNVVLTLIRNLVFLVTVLFHGIRRLFPPY